MIQTFWGSEMVRPRLEWTVRAYQIAQSESYLPTRTSQAYFKGTSTTSFRASSCRSALSSSKGPGMVIMVFCRRVSLGRYSRGTEMFGKYFSWRLNSSFWAWTRTFSLEVKMRSHVFQASTKHSHPRQPGSAFRISWHWTLSGCRRIRFLGP